MTNLTPITDSDLHAYVDGQIDAERRALIEAHLATNPEMADTVASYRAQRVALHEAFDSILSEPLPASMVRRPAFRWVGTATRIAAALILIVLGGAGGWLLRGEAVPVAQVAAVTAPHAGDPFPTWARVAHVVYLPEVRRAVEVKADDATLVPWLAKRVGTPISAPDLKASGFQLQGGRLIPGESKPAAQFLYQDDAGRRITLYVRHGDTGDRKTGFLFDDADGVGVYYWIDGDRGYALAGDLDRDTLRKVAMQAYEHMAY